MLRRPKTWEEWSKDVCHGKTSPKFDWEAHRRKEDEKKKEAARIAEEQKQIELAAHKEALQKRSEAEQASLFDFLEQDLLVSHHSARLLPRKQRKLRSCRSKTSS